MLFWRSKIFAVLKLLVRNPFYLALALVLASLLFAVYFWINDLALYRSAAAISTAPAFLWKVFSNQVSTVYRSIGSIDVIAVGAIAALGGVNLALTVLRIRRTKVFVGRAGFASLLGTAGGAFAVSCSACSTALISLLGVAGGLAIL
ncbi:MAG: hypothetical protein WD940_01860, partial [Patescibacteria group bacterium]